MLRALPIVLALVATARADKPPDVTGCWDVQQGATLTIEKGTFRATFKDPPRGGPTTMSGSALWVAAAKEYEVSCRPRSQHGSFCRIAPEGDGLRVRVYAHPYNDPRKGKLVESFVAARCRK